VEPARRAALVHAKLNALARDGLAIDPGQADVVGFPAGAALVSAGRAVVYVADDMIMPLGAAVVWAAGRDVAQLDLILDDAGTAGVAARQAAALRHPVAVWLTRAGTLTPAEPAAVAGAGAEAPLDPAVVAAIERAGASVVVEAGVVVGEVAGLEVARVVADGGRPTVRVGVGVYDQEAHAVLHPGDTSGTGLAEVVTRVAGLRRPGAPGHLINRLARERWLRWRVLQEPGLVGATELVALPGLVAPRGLHHSLPAAAIGTGRAGRRVLAVFAAGVDPQVIAVAADHLAVHGGAAGPGIDEVVLVLAPADTHPALARAAAWLAVPATLCGVAGPWETGAAG
jgi:hypothetical protein